MARSRPTSPITAETMDLEKPDSSMTLPKTAPSRNTGKYELHEADHLVHEDAGEDGRHRRGIGQEHGQHRRDGREQDDAEAAVGDEHQQHEGADGDQKGPSAFSHAVPIATAEFARAFVNKRPYPSS